MEELCWKIQEPISQKINEYPEFLEQNFNEILEMLNYKDERNRDSEAKKQLVVCLKQPQIATQIVKQATGSYTLSNSPSDVAVLALGINHNQRTISPLLMSSELEYLKPNIYKKYSFGKKDPNAKKPFPVEVAVTNKLQEKINSRIASLKHLEEKPTQLLKRFFEDPYSEYFKGKFLRSCDKSFEEALLRAAEQAESNESKFFISEDILRAWDKIIDQANSRYSENNSLYQCLKPSFSNAKTAWEMTTKPFLTKLGQKLANPNKEGSINGHINIERVGNFEISLNDGKKSMAIVLKEDLLEKNKPIKTYFSDVVGFEDNEDPLNWISPNNVKLDGEISDWQTILHYGKEDLNKMLSNLSNTLEEVLMIASFSGYKLQATTETDAHGILGKSFFAHNSYCYPLAEHLIKKVLQEKQDSLFPTKISFNIGNLPIEATLPANHPYSAIYWLSKASKQSIKELLNEEKTFPNITLVPENSYSTMRSQENTYGALKTVWANGMSIVLGKPMAEQFNGDITNIFIDLSEENLRIPFKKLKYI